MLEPRGAGAELRCAATDPPVPARPPLQIHLLHIIPVPMPEVVGGFGAMDSIVTVDPDPKEDLKVF